MTSEYDQLERLLAEHAAARECSLLVAGLTAAERRRVASEMQSVADGSRCRKSRRPWPRTAWLVGAAAALILAVTLWTWDGRHDHLPPEETGQVGTEAPRENQPPPEEPRAEFLNGRGRLVPAGEDTRYTLVDAARCRIRLDQGELFIEVPAGEELRAYVETPAGTVTARETSFYAHYGETDAPRSPFLTVAVLGGFVEVRNRHGGATAGAGEVVLAEGTLAPKRHVGAPAIVESHLRERSWWRFGSVLGMLQRPQVQVELKLSQEQKSKLKKPAGADWRELGMYFRDLYSIPAEERGKKAAEFRGMQERRTAEALDADQQRRLGQILLQQHGLSALAHKELADLLKLSEEQRRQVEAVTKEFSQARRSAFSRGGWNWQEVGKRLDELRRQEVEKLEALLTVAQKQQWQVLIGAPFKLERRAGDLRDWWDSGNWGWWDSGNWIDWRDHWRDPESWRGRWGPGSDGWRNRKDAVPPKEGREP